MSTEKGDSFVEIAMQYTDSYNENIISFANNIHTTEGGTHEQGFKTALTRILNDYAKRNNILKNEEKLSGEDVREGLSCVISVKITEAQFEGQTKTKLGNSEVTALVTSAMNEDLTAFLEENPAIAKTILEKSLTASRAREAARRARDLTRRKSALEGASLPGKLADCSDRNNEYTEIYIVGTSISMGVNARKPVPSALATASLTAKLPAKREILSPACRRSSSVNVRTTKESRSQAFRTRSISTKSVPTPSIIAHGTPSLG